MTGWRRACKSACPMSRRQVILLEKQRDELLAQMRAIPNLMRGSLYVRRRRCGRPGCICAGPDGIKHTGAQLTVGRQGKTRTRFVREDEFEEVGGWVAGYRLLWRLVDELTEVNLRLLTERRADRMK